MLQSCLTRVSDHVHIEIQGTTLPPEGACLRLSTVPFQHSQQLVSLQAQIRIENEEEEVQVQGITKLSVTRWTVRATSFQRILDNYTYLTQLWDDCLKDKLTTDDVKARIIGCKSQMSKFSLFFGLNLGLRLYAHTDNLSKALQTTKMSATSSKRLANLTIDVFQGMRNENNFNLLYDAICKKAKNHSFIGEPLLQRKRTVPNYSSFHLVDGHGEGSEAHSPNTPRDYYRKIYYEALDTFVLSLRERFDQPCFVAFENLESSLLKPLHNEDYNSVIRSLYTLMMWR